ncbi:TRAM LAG1 and CLN8 (TLC) lipid-sensing domain containing protein [Zea mays]|uniref:TRAM LAG1 and CLN8 (TLC) lipid-sensing domain containing protein n=1 Tax=Zea mays TaxID=4577 RepID=A0A1D6GKN0_MAIZE|nr:TRAM LAG1 and CLN8 (TLC) lipid-sensing domain containing protein [Zea mays]
MAAMTAYKYQAQALMRDYLLADPLVPYTSVLIGIVLCKMAYDFTRILSSFYFKGYTLLTKIQRIEWNNRGPITFRYSIISTSALGVSVGYFITDLAMIFWLYPSLGGMEYVLHHTVSLVAIAYTMLSGEGQFYTYMVLISETTTPEINLRWFLDTAGLKKSSAYLVNGILMFVAWLVARIFLFMYVFYHIYLHYGQIMQMHAFGYYLTFVVPSVLFVMNTMWFMKILKGVMKTLAKWP